MDSIGWNARRRAEKESAAYVRAHHGAPLETVQPMPENYIGGYMPHQHAHGIPSPPAGKHEGHHHHHLHPKRSSWHPKAYTDGDVPEGQSSFNPDLPPPVRQHSGGLRLEIPSGDASTKPGLPPNQLAPPLPPKDGLPFRPQSVELQRQQQYGFPATQELQEQQAKPPIPHATDFGGVPAPLPPEPKDDPLGTDTGTVFNPTHSTMVSSKQLTKMSAVDRSRVLRMARMEPHIQFMCGPLLKFDTVDEQDVWHGAALIVTADSASIYEPYPSLTYEWDPERVVLNTFSRFQASSSAPTVASPAPSPTPRRKSFSRKAFKAAKPEVTVTGSNGSANGHQTMSPDGDAAGDYRVNNGSPSAWNQLHGVPSFDLGPHPADPHSTLLPASPMVTLHPTWSNTSTATSHTSASFPPSSNSHTPPTSNPSFNGSNKAASSTQDGFRTPVAGFPYGGPGGYGILNTNAQEARTAHMERVQGEELYVYGGAGGTFTFWRFKIQIPLAEREMGVRYCVNNGQQMEFYVPAKGGSMRLAAHSCNGFSAGVNPDDFRGPGFKSGYDPVWMDLLSKHAQTPFHALVGGGDQLYCDSMMREPEMQEWISKTKPAEKKAFPLTEEMSLGIDRFFFNHYCQHFRSGAFARANSSIPMINMCDDHDLIDGFGSYPDDLQMAPVFRAVGSRGYFFFLLFQCFINPEVDGVSDLPGRHPFKSMIIGPEAGPFIPFPSHSSLSRLGPKEYILMLDCRAERKKDQICSPGEYAKVFEKLHSLPSGVEHLIVQLGIPIAYPRMVFLEAALESKFNPLVALGKNGSMGLGGFVNKFNAEAELLDDLNDHWTARNHKKERNWLVEQLQHFSRSKGIRVTFVSGDVHCAAVGVFKTLRPKGKKDMKPEEDWRYMQNIVTSAIVNTPPPNAVITMVSSLATKVHKTLHHIDTDETMIPIFTQDPAGHPRKQKFIMGRRNWCRIERADDGSMIFDIRVEREKGYGATVGYATRVPGPGWTPTP